MASTPKSEDKVSHSKSTRQSHAGVSKAPADDWNIDLSAIPSFPDDLTESDLQLPADCYLLKKQNEGFQFPFFLTSEAEVSKIRPPAVVKTWEQRFAELDAKQQEHFHKFVETVKAAEWYDEKKNDDWCCLRYLVARSYDVRKAFAMLEKSAKWRKETGADEWKCDACVENPNQHMGQFIGWDKEHRPVMFMSMRWGPERKNPLRHMVSCFNHMITLMPVGVEKWVCITDFESYSHWRDSNPSMGLGVIHTIQDHYPERLGKMVCVNPPRLFWGLYKMFYAVIDPVTRTKVEFAYTEDKPSAYDAFPTLFSPTMCAYFYDSYNRSKHNLPAKPLVWTPNPDGYPRNYEERKQQLKSAKEEEKKEHHEAKAAEKAKKEEEKRERHAERETKKTQK